MSIAAQGDELVSFRRSTGARLRGRWCTVSRVGAVSVFLFVVRLFLMAVLVPTSLTWFYRCFYVLVIYLSNSGSQQKTIERRRQKAHYNAQWESTY